MTFVFDLVSFVLGALAGGAACAVSAKAFGWFQKQEKSVASKV
jgi:hypothetical protein